MRETRHHFRPLIQQRAIQLRREQAPAEARLWQRLRARQLGGFHFRRQQPLGEFIVDFFCAHARLVIELDGDSHSEPGAEEYDATRTRWLESHGLLVTRFDNTNVFESMDSVLEQILRLCQERAGLGDKRRPPPPGPLPQGAGE